MNGFQIIGLKAVSAVCLPLCALQYGAALVAWPVAHFWDAAGTASHQQRCLRRIEAFHNGKRRLRAYWSRPYKPYIQQGPPIMPWFEWTGIFFDALFSTAWLSWGDWWADILPTIHTRERIANALWFPFVALLLLITLNVCVFYPVIYFAVYICGPAAPYNAQIRPPFWLSWAREVREQMAAFVQYVETSEVERL